MGNFAQFLYVVGLEKDLLKLAVNDTLDRKLEDADLIVKEKVQKKNTISCYGNCKYK